MSKIIILALISCLLKEINSQVPVTSKTWSELLSDTNIWSARNGKTKYSIIIKMIGLQAHATCKFQDKLWLAGGHSDLYPTYNLEFNDKTADVWVTTDAGLRNILFKSG